MIKPVTYQGVFNFNANLYALEVKSRFIDQSKANGFYRGYGDELAATIVGSSIQIGTGAFVIQGRMNEIVTAETVSPQIFDGFVGYVVARIETYHPSDEENCTLVAYVNRTYEAITLQQDDVYERAADNTNKVYELPIYSFEISGTSIVNLKKLIGAVEDYATIKSIVDGALATAQTAVNTANSAVGIANGAVQTANDANAKSDAAGETAGNAVDIANAATDTANGAMDVANASNAKSEEALSTANGLDGKITEAIETADNAVGIANGAVQTASGAVDTVKEQHDQMTAEIAELEKAIVTGQGTTVTRGGELQTTYEVENVVETTDTIIFSGGSV